MLQCSDAKHTVLSLNFTRDKFAGKSLMFADCDLVTRLIVDCHHNKNKTAFACMTVSNMIAFKSKANHPPACYNCSCDLDLDIDIDPMTSICEFKLCF